MRAVFIAGIGTDVGKTIVSACLAQALQADYWKPIQCGKELVTDSNLVKDLLSNSRSKVHSEVFCFKQPISPHAAAAAEKREFSLAQLKLPSSQNNILLIEGVGGLLVPLNSKELCIDLISHFNCDVILVSRNYLGSINHTLLSVEALQSRQIKPIGIIFNGDANQTSEEAILNFSKLPFLGRIQNLTQINSDTIANQAKNLKLEVFL